MIVWTYFSTQFLFPSICVTSAWTFSWTSGYLPRLYIDQLSTLAVVSCPTMQRCSQFFKNILQEEDCVMFQWLVGSCIYFKKMLAVCSLKKTKHNYWFCCLRHRQIDSPENIVYYLTSYHWLCVSKFISGREVKTGNRWSCLTSRLHVPCSYGNDAWIWKCLVVCFKSEILSEKFY